MTQRPTPPRLLRLSEVAAIWNVDPKTVTRWAEAGRLSCTRTLGGHRRFRDDEVRALLDRLTTPATDSPLDSQAVT
ncbi:MAG TPA: BldC family transcriptional regulator [Actinomycetota bacterium]|nr:BldC family transcriptional regulator [Actinomycetota bacterium]